MNQNINPNPYLSELTADQIYVEMLKRFPEKEYDDYNGGSMYYFFGPEWELLHPGAREEAEDSFVEGIRAKIIKGIKFGLESRPNSRQRHKVRDDHGDIVYWRIPNDNYKRG